MSDPKPLEHPAYFSSVEGHLVSRYGAGRALIGASHTPTGVAWTPKLVVAISEGEWASYRREYEIAVREGALVRRTHADFVAQGEAEERENKRKVEALEAAKKKAEAEAEAAKKKLEAAEAEAKTPKKTEA